ncbi:hypothetical protein R1sor_000408 [Riccia sorocarpa]|uniref:RING-CH-type domain-containing protein n=1 Tax=Riccia sorocarpa TaxID=122646 RepID=A0ABD3GUQ5_9MARC
MAILNMVPAELSGPLSTHSDTGIRQQQTENHHLNDGPGEEALKSDVDCHTISVVATKAEMELDVYSYKSTSSCPSTRSVSSCEFFCRICQLQHSEEAVVELGCQCRGELALAHLRCMEQWFGNKGTNMCEVCQQVAVNVPPELSVIQPTQDFWIWSALTGTRGGSRTERNGNGEEFAPWQVAPQFHPFSAALLILSVLLLFDGLIFIMLRGTPLPARIGVGALLVGGFVATVRLVVLEICRRRQIERALRQISGEPRVAPVPTTGNVTTIGDLDFMFVKQELGYC